MGTLKDNLKPENTRETFTRIKSITPRIGVILNEMQALEAKYPSSVLTAGGDLAQLIVQSEMETGARDLVARRAYNARLAAAAAAARPR